ncbi:uncharacterized protein VP01_148g1 [Puccinia sorghi]|uniref:Uncharacterized protein n=1 Tax=Puccinia sorghi TaxID=27349 RepID=A0A0L6VJI7_9BASI|nr:uncharacterized protein VP01_148g1 [Puccinia sorghi]
MVLTRSILSKCHQIQTFFNSSLKMIDLSSSDFRTWKLPQGMYCRCAFVLPLEFQAHQLLLLPNICYREIAWLWKGTKNWSLRFFSPTVKPTTKILNKGIYWVDRPEVGYAIGCGCFLLFIVPTICRPRFMISLIRTQIYIACLWNACSRGKIAAFYPDDFQNLLDSTQFRETLLKMAHTIKDNAFPDISIFIRILFGNWELVTTNKNIKNPWTGEPFGH